MKNYVNGNLGGQGPGEKGAGSVREAGEIGKNYATLRIYFAREKVQRGGSQQK